MIKISVINKRILICFMILVISFECFVVVGYSYPTSSEINIDCRSNYDYSHFYHNRNALIETENGTLWFLDYHADYSTDRNIRAFYWNSTFYNATWGAWIEAYGTSHGEILAYSAWKGCYPYQNGFYYDGTYVHFVSKGAGTAQDDTCYRRGKFLDNGTVIWDSAIQLGDTIDGQYPSVVVDSNGFAYFVALNSDATRIYLWKNGNNDGTWNLDYAMNITNEAYSYSTSTKAIITSDDIIYVFLGEYTQETIECIIIENDVVQSSELIVTDLDYFIDFDVNIDSNDNIYLAYRSTTDNALKCIINYSDNSTWGESYTFDLAQSDSFPLITYDKKAELMYFAWLESLVYIVDYDLILNQWGETQQFSDELPNMLGNNLFSKFVSIEYNEVGYAFDTSNTVTYNPYYIGFGLDEYRTPSAIIIPSEPIDYNFLFTITGFITMIVIGLVIMYVKQKGGSL